MTLNIWVVLYACGFAMGLFMTAMFLLFYKRYSRQTLNVAIVLFIIALMLFEEMAQESDMTDPYAFLIGLGMLMDLLIWPFLIFYTQYITGASHQKTWVKALYFIPFFIGLVSQVPTLLMPNENQLAYYSQGMTLKLLTLVTFKMTVAMSSLIFMLSLLNRRISMNVLPPVKSRKTEYLQKVSWFFIGITVMVAFIYSLFYNNYFQLLPLGDSDRIGSLIISGFLYLFGGLVFRNPQLFQGESYSMQIVNFFGGREQYYSESLLKLFEVDKIHLDEKLTVKDVATRMGLTSQQLSYLINQYIGISFLDLINSFRVEEVKEKIKKGEHNKKTLLGLALDCGFNSKASFNRVFKEHLGLSPSDYAKKEKYQDSISN